MGEFARSPLDPPKGCVFSTRCPHVADALPRRGALPRDLIDGREVACPLWPSSFSTVDFLLGSDLGPVPVRRRHGPSTRSSKSVADRSRRLRPARRGKGR